MYGTTLWRRLTDRCTAANSSRVLPENDSRVSLRAISRRSLKHETQHQSLAIRSSHQCGGKRIRLPFTNCFLWHKLAQRINFPLLNPPASSTASDHNIRNSFKLSSSLSAVEIGASFGNRLLHHLSCLQQHWTEFSYPRGIELDLCAAGASSPHGMVWMQWMHW
jgi:hypothetical protein